MPAITNKQQLLNHAYTALAKKFPLPESSTEPSGRSVLEELIYAACREGATHADADRAYATLRKSFIDWNEVRVSTVQEVADALRPLPQPGTRAKRIVALRDGSIVANTTDLAQALQALHSERSAESGEELLSAGAE